MKKIFRTVAALAVVMFAGCTNDLTNDVVAPVGEGTTVTLGLDTKTSLGELVDGSRKVYWSAGDQININGNTSKETVIDADNKGLATFSFGKILNTPYSILYPAEDYKDPSTITLPAVQAAASGSFGVDAAPMAAYVTAVGETPLLHHLTAVIRLQLKAAADGDTHDIYKVEFRGGGNEQVSGDFAINYQTATLTATSTAVADQVVTARVNKSLSTEAATDVFIVVPAQEYAGFTVRVIDEYGHFMEKSSTATIELAKGQIVAMPEFPFEPTGTDVNVEIKSAAELVAFAKAYNAGDYEDVRPLVVEVKNDIVFDDATNAEWEPIGGKFDGVDRYFDGVFNGNNFSVKSWNSTRPLFGYTSATGTIQDLTIDASCILTANFADEEQYYGAFVGYHRGTLINCHVNANLTASGNWGNAEPHVGALVGRVVVGSVENCTVSGDVTITNTLVTNGEKSYYGGAVGRVSNAAGVIKGVSVSGNVSHSAGSTYIAEGSTNPSDASVYYGGIVGNLAGTCTDCHLTNADKKFFYGNYIYNDGPTNQVENHYRTQNVGSIVGQVEEGATVSNCTNRAEVVFNQYNGSRNGSSDVSRFLYGGGIAGHVYGEISNCTIYSSILNRSSCLQQFIGGVVGRLEASATISICANEGTSVSCGTTSLGYYQARNNNIGGVIGISFSTALSQLSNKAEVACSRMNNNATATLSMGGIVGKIDVTGEIDGKNAIVNYGAVQTSHNQESIRYTAVGGIAGVSKANLKNVINEGNVSRTKDIYKTYFGGIVGHTEDNITLTSCTNKGAISNTGAVRDFLYLGGIIGGVAEDKTITITSCTNEGTVSNTAALTIPLYLGGIVPVVNEQINLVTCTNEGEVKNTGAITTNAFLGGIAGATSVNLTGHTNKGKVTLKVPADVSNTLFAGGIVGTVLSNVTLDNLTNEGTVYMDITASPKNVFHYNLCVGGIIGTDGDETAANITNSTNSGAVAAKTSERSNGRSLAMGGIAGALTNSNSKLYLCTCTGVVNNVTDNNANISYGLNAQVIRTSGGATWQGGIVGFVEGTADKALSVEECTFNRTTHDPNNYRHTGYANSANRGENGGLAGSAKYADIKNCICYITVEGQSTTDVAGLVCWLVNSNLEGCTLANSTVHSAGTSGYLGGLVALSEASTIKDNIMNNVTLSGTATKNAVLAGKSDAASSFTDNKISGTFLGNDITLSSTMIADDAGATITGTTLYTE